MSQFPKTSASTYTRGLRVEEANQIEEQKRIRETRKWTRKIVKEKKGLVPDMTFKLYAFQFCLRIFSRSTPPALVFASASLFTSLMPALL